MLNKFKECIDTALSSLDDWKKLRMDWCEGRFPIMASGARGPFGAAIVAKLATYTSGALLVVLPDEFEARAMESDLRVYTDDVMLFPWWGTMLYRGISPQAAIFGKRATVLANLVSGEKSIVVTSLHAAIGRIPPPESMAQNLLKIAVGDDFDPVNVDINLVRFGYNRVPRVSVPGEFALRGEVLDIHPLGDNEALRVVFGWNGIEKIRSFDPLTQASTRELDHITLHPLREHIWTPENIEAVVRQIPEEFAEKIQEKLQTTGELRGEELFYPLAYDAVSTVQDYLGKGGASIFFDIERLWTAEEKMRREHNELYSQIDADFVPDPTLLVNSFDSVLQGAPSRLLFHGMRAENQKQLYNLSSEPGRSFFGNISYLKDEITALLETGYTIFIFAESESQSQRIAYLLREMDGIEVGPAALSSGFSLPHAKIFAVQENEIFGRRKNVPTSIRQAKSEIIETFVDLDPGDFVVHVNHGIGLFKGIKRIRAGGAERDYIELLYASEEIVFIPIEQVNLIQRYIGGHGRSPRLDKIGGTAWEKKKSKVKRSVNDLADYLVNLYARRSLSVGYAFPKDDDFQISFEASFPWQETEDQLKAIAAVKNDMESSKPMDRLICGDVGYGKTEIAMRAAFKAVMGGRQVAYLCPTTILAEQHHESFTERFKRFPITIGMLSRFVSPAERKRVIQGLGEGEVDIIIGTHRILSKDVISKNMGLFIIDEEQRFGVKDKERLKQLKTSVDCLTLSATPIPRTLHMSLTKIRDMSLLKTAPQNRRPIETFIQEFDADIVAQAIRREIERGGQVFYLHNRVENLERIQNFLRELLPEIFVELAHGQMPPRDLENVMHRFVHGAFQVLLSTTIIENGIDIPNVNTIIIDRADMYGISQLYQLRGRVGRSGRLAYAYLLYPHGYQISELAMKRLQVISDFTELGSGFKIAMKDLEVRGAGNLLGPQQSGDVYAIGFDLYLRLLEEAIQKRTNSENEDDIPETLLELEYSGFIPDTYIVDESEKMEVYKKIAAVSDDQDLEALNSELFDRFGPLPDEVHSLISMAEIRIICRKLKIISLKERRGSVQVVFGKVSQISVNKVMNLMQSSGGHVKLNPTRPDGLILETGQVGLKEKSSFLRERLEILL